MSILTAYPLRSCGGCHGVSYCSGVEGRGKSYPSLVWRRSSASGVSSSEDDEPNGNVAQARDEESTDEAADLSEPFIRECIIQLLFARPLQPILFSGRSRPPPLFSNL